MANLATAPSKPPLPKVNVSTVLAAANYYEMLGLRSTAVQKEATFKNAYRRAVLLVHPDKATSAERERANDAFNRLNEAYKTLSDSFLRSAYDGELRSRGHQKRRPGQHEREAWRSKNVDEAQRFRARYEKQAAVNPRSREAQFMKDLKRTAKAEFEERQRREQEDLRQERFRATQQAKDEAQRAKQAADRLQRAKQRVASLKKQKEANELQRKKAAKRREKARKKARAVNAPRPSRLPSKGLPPSAGAATTSPSPPLPNRFRQASRKVSPKAPKEKPPAARSTTV